MPDSQEVTDNLLKRGWNSHDLDELMSNYVPDAVYVSPSGSGEGREEIASFFGVLHEAFADLQVIPWQKVTSDDVEVVQWTFTGTHTGPFLMPGGLVLEATGRRVAIRGCGIRILENGLILTHTIYYDQLELVSQLGAELALPGEAHAPENTASEPPATRRWPRPWRGSPSTGSAPNTPKKPR